MLKSDALINVDRTSTSKSGVIILAGGNLNGRVMRLVADELAECGRLKTRLLGIFPLLEWSEQPGDSHLVAPIAVEWDQIRQHLAGTSAFVFAPSFRDGFWDLVREAKSLGIPTVCVLADIGFGAERFEGIDQVCMPDLICVSDPVTLQLCLDIGVPEERLFKSGSPYLDTMIGQRLPDGPAGTRRIGLLLGTERLSPQKKRCSGRPERTLLEGVHSAVRAIEGMEMTVRLHPRIANDPSLVPEDAALDPLYPRSTFFDFLTHHHQIIASMSTGLLVARILGRHALSFQPDRDRACRLEIFEAWGIPVVHHVDEVEAWLRETRDKTPELLCLDGKLYQPGKSLAAITDLVHGYCQLNGTNVMNHLNL